MRTRRLLTVLFLSSLAACQQWTPLDDLGGWPSGSDRACPALPDLAPAPPRCAAAKGLTGESLLCVDFKDVRDLSSLPNWNFACLGAFTWTTGPSGLQVKDFATFDKECTVILPAQNLNDPDKQNYRSVTVSLVQRIDLSDPEQKATIYLNDASDATRLLYFATGKKNPSRQVTTMTFERSELPTAINQSPQWILRVSSTGFYSRQGWQIESIAVMGNL
jgi:hypothetical protein